jgi:peptide/nickel transport system substrate-binding protein
LDTWEGPTASQTMHLVLEPLLREDFGGKLVGRLAESWDINSSQDPPNIVFHLRKGVKFSDGTDFNAQAASWAYGKAKEGGMTAGTTNFWKSIDVVDDYTLRINFTTWRNTWLRSFSESVAMISSPTAFQKNGVDWVRNNMVGTGAFLQSNYQRDVSFTGVKNPNFWETGYPYLDQVQLLYVADRLTRDALFKSGGAEIMDMQPQQAASYQSADYNIATEPAGAAILVPDSINTDSPWSNLKVRQAAEYAIDKDAIVKAFGYGYWQTAYQYSTPAMIGWDPNFSGTRTYDVAKAKQLLSDAGYPNGFKTAIISSPAAIRDVATALQAYLGKIGIQVELQFPEAAQYQAYANGTWKNALLFDTQIGAANNNVGLNFNFGVPPSVYKSVSKPDGWKDVVSASLTAPNPDVTLIRKAVKMMYDDAMCITVYYSTVLWAQQSYVQDSGAGTRGNTQYWNPQYAWLKR